MAERLQKIDSEDRDTLAASRRGAWLLKSAPPAAGPLLTSVLHPSSVGLLEMPSARMVHSGGDGYPHLDRAPITEALIDYRVQPRDGITADAFSGLAKRLADTFPGAPVQLNTFEARLGFDDGGRPLPAVQQHQPLGLMLRNNSSAEVVQFKVDGFTYNKLAPYTSWDEIYPRASQFWEAYAAVAEPQQIVRLAVRFINKIRLPLPVADLADYLRMTTVIPSELPQQIRHFLHRVVLYEPQDDTSAIVTQALEPSLPQDHVVILFDTDAFREVRLPLDSGAVDETFQSLRRLKNRIFFNGLTPKTLELFR